jgi:DNA polymerase-3 subunit epsilon
MLEAMHARPRLVLARHPTKDLWDALWVVGGRVADFGALPSDRGEISERTAAAMTGAARLGVPGSAASVPAGEVDEVRIVASWIARHEPPMIELDDPVAAADWALSETAGAPAEPASRDPETAVA